MLQSFQSIDYVIGFDLFSISTIYKRVWVDSSACQKMACHFLRCHFGDLEKFLVPKLWQGILATKWHAIFNVPFWTLRKNFGAKIMARYFNVPFIMCHFGHLKKILVPKYGKVFCQQKNSKCPKWHIRVGHRTLSEPWGCKKSYIRGPDG